MLGDALSKLGKEDKFEINFTFGVVLVGNLNLYFVKG